MPDTTLPIRRFQCRHIFPDGHRCGSPCLRGEDFCYYHHATRGARLALAPHDGYNEPPNQTTFSLPLPEDHSSIQLAIGTVLNRLASNALDPRRAGLMLYALQIASGNLATQPRHSADDLVHDITLDPAQGILAPSNELPEDARDRAIYDSLPEDDEDDEDFEDFEDDENPEHETEDNDENLEDQDPHRAEADDHQPIPAANGFDALGLYRHLCQRQGTNYPFGSLDNLPPAFQPHRPALEKLVLEPLHPAWPSPLDQLHRETGAKVPLPTLL